METSRPREENLRIQNTRDLINHENRAGRTAALKILEAGLAGADPYTNTRKLIRKNNGKLVFGFKQFEPRGTPNSGRQVFEISKLKHVYVFGAGKGCQNIAKAIEDSLGDSLTGGHVIDKKSHEIILNKIGVTLGGHPLPDEDCISGCKRIMNMADRVEKNDLVITIATNGISSLLTMPVPNVSLKDLRKTIYTMQIERGAPTRDLNAVRNHLDLLKGGRISLRVGEANTIHIIALDPGIYANLMFNNFWLATLPDCSTFQDARLSLKKWNAWNSIPHSVRDHLEKADPHFETVKAKQFQKLSFRIFGIMPNSTGMTARAKTKARELGYRPMVIAEGLKVEAKEAGRILATIAKTMEKFGNSKRPSALLSSGEFVVTVGKEKGIGGRNQEFVLSAALGIEGYKNIVIASVDSDGTDGPGGQFVSGRKVPCLSGGIVDGDTVKESKQHGINIEGALRKHDTTMALWKLKSGILSTRNISLDDLTVMLIGRPGRGR